jgi:cephalosporin hydroxylase
MKEVLGAFQYKGLHTTQQVPNIKYFFEKLLVEENFDVIIELGTSLAGLTYILDDIVKENNLKHNIHTFDIGYRDYVEKQLNERNCVYHILDERDAIYKSTVVDLMTNNAKVLLLCDGGNKKEEFNRYSEYLKSGDVIMAHDYCHDRDLFENEIKDTIWNWFEISFSDIENSVKDNNLIIYPKVDFKNAVWACYQKQ